MPSGTLHINPFKTPLSMEARLKERLEPEILQKWRSMDVYHMILEDRRDAETFILHDGPPFASGETHIGVGFDKVLKDMIVKYQSMRGKRVPFVPGWDCHGLPIEAEVRNHLSIRQFPLTPIEIRNHCYALAIKHIKEQKGQFQRLGIFADWDRPYMTMAPSYEAGVLEILSDIRKRGYVYHGLRPVHWCPVCQSVLADAEIEMVTVDRDTALVHYPVTPSISSLFGINDEPVSLLASTRDIWSLTSCVAICVAGDRIYVALRWTTKDGTARTIIVEETKADEVCRRIGIPSTAEIGRVNGAQMERLEVIHPFTQQRLPVILDQSFAEKDMKALDKRSTTGVAPVSPAHYFEDFEIAASYQLAVPILVDAQGDFMSGAGELAGQNIRAAEATILDWMREQETLAYVEIIKGEGPRGTRCKHPVIVSATKQWFLDIDHVERPGEKSIRDKALEEADNQISWIPEGDNQLFQRELRERQDWCISRQRVWGIPIPTIYCFKCNEVILESEIIEVARDLTAAEGGQAWFKIGIDDLLNKPALSDFSCPKCHERQFGKDPDPSILDVWFESGTSWRAALINDHRLSFPADLCVEGLNQHSGWFQRSLLTSLMVRGKSPFRSVLIHGFVRDEKQKRMDNMPSFRTLATVLEKQPVDLIRLYFVWNKNLRRDFSLTEELIGGLDEEYRLFRNAFRYLLGHLSDFVPGDDAIPLRQLDETDKWILSQLDELIEHVTAAYEGIASQNQSEAREPYDIREAVKLIYEFCKEELNKIYFEVVKDRLKYANAKSPLRRSTQTAMHSLLMALVKMLAPILVYTCEEVWSQTLGVYDCPSVHMSLWPDLKGGIMTLLGEEEGQKLKNDYKLMRQLRRSLHLNFEKARQARIIGENLDATLTLFALPSAEITQEFLQQRSEQLREFLTVSELRIAETGDDLEDVEGCRGISCRVEKCPHKQCIRCKRYDASVGINQSQPVFCQRCADVIDKIEVHYDEIEREQARQISIGPQTSPADLAAFLKSQDIRKVAFLNEEGLCKAYYFHLPSQQVQEHLGLRPLANFIQNSDDFRDHSAILLGLGEHTDVLFGIGIHKLTRGTPLGGTRESHYPKMESLLTELLRLSYGMSVKNAIANLPHGGGKSIIDPCGIDLKVHRELRRRVYRDFGQFTATLFGRYICAEDAGNTTTDTREMLSCCRHVMCLPEVVGGSGNPSRFTSLVAWVASKVGWSVWLKKDGRSKATNALDGTTVAIQGVGNVGLNLIDIITEGETGLKKLLVADTEPVQIENVRKLLHRKGKAHLLEVRSAKDPLENRDKATTDQIAAVRESLQKEDDKETYILYSQCDILFPAARGNMIYANKENPSINNVDFLHCKVIVPIANNAYSDNDLIGRLVWERGIVDVVEGNVNWGGATVAASELYGYDEDHVIDWCVRKVYQDTTWLLTTADERNVPPWEVLKLHAEERIKKPHPVIEKARSENFILDTSKDFPTWIKERWLRNISSVDPDSYASYVADWTYKTLQESVR